MLACMWLFGLSQAPSTAAQGLLSELTSAAGAPELLACPLPALPPPAQLGGQQESPQQQLRLHHHQPVCCAGPVMPVLLSRALLLQLL